jgi:hypothetical protein
MEQKTQTTEPRTHPGGKREKFYTVSARLVFSSIIVILILALILGASVIINKGPIFPILGVISVGPSVTYPIIVTNNTGYPGATPMAPIIISVTCNPNAPVFGCLNPVFNTTTGILTVAIKQTSGYNWTLVTVQFIKPGVVYAQGPPTIPEVSWSPPAAVNVTGGLLNNTIRYVNIPIASGPVSVGTNITGSIWAKYQYEAGSAQHYANMSSAVIVIKRAS